MDSTDENDREEPRPEAAQDSRTLDQALAAGEKRLDTWTADGTLLNGEEFALRRSVPINSLFEAEKRGDLFALWIDGQRWYPSVVLSVSPLDVGRICRALGDLSPVSKMFFFMHAHGGLDGLTVSAALPSVGVARVLQLAEAWRVS